MEVVFTVIMGEIANRSLSFLIDKYSKETSPAMEERLHSLKRLLLRVRVIVEEAEGRDIRNQAMVQQLNLLRKEMYRGYYILDSFRNQASDETKAEVSYSFALSKFNPAKRLFFSDGGTQCLKEVQQVLASLNHAITDMSEFLALVKNYPLLYRQPYNMHLLLDRCMFGRQMETERVMNFLLQIEPPNAEAVGVLPIIGPRGVGKSTLVAHVYGSERVRNHFTRIVLVAGDDIADKKCTTLADGGVTIHRNNSWNGNERLLVIIETSGDVDDVPWNRLCLASASGSKIIITGRSNKIASFGTTQALVLNILPREAFWYFFKVLSFGSADPQLAPKLEWIAQQIAGEMKGSFVGANIVWGFLNKSLDYQRWCKVLKRLRQRTSPWSHKHSYGLVPQSNPLSFVVMDNDDVFVVYDRYETRCANAMLPTIKLDDVLFGDVRCQGRFEALAWKSRVPPYATYVCSCAMYKPQRY